MKKLIISLIVAAFFTWIAAGDLLDSPEGVAADAFYQSERATDGTIIVVGIDDRALDEIGPMPWSRNVMADAIMYLNSGGEGNRPAVIGIDTIYDSEGSDPFADEYLTEAVGLYGNVVVGGVATFGSVLDIDGENFEMKDRTVLYWDGPFAALEEAADVGHINGMSDSDGILRHALLTVDVPDQGEIPSFSRVIYEKYCASEGIAPNPTPRTIDGFYYIPFTGKAGAYYEGISIADLINEEVDPAYFAHKVVLIGPYAAALQDEYRTSIEHAAPMYGIEIHANLIDAFKRGVYASEAGKRMELAILFMLSAGLVFFFMDRKLKAALPVWAVVTFGWLAVCALGYRAGVILHVLWIPLSATVIFVGCIAANYARSQRERQRVRDTFGRYVDPAIMNELLTKGGEALALGGREVEIAVLFVDVRGFTTMSEALPPATVVEIINKYLSLTTECIMRYHGTLDKFVGDCTMAFWNAPVAQEDPVYLACRAAMDMVEGSKALGEELQKEYGRSVSFGVGVNWGPAVVGNIGAERRMDYTAIGDTVNTAARLEANAPGGTVYISRVVADALGDRATTVSLGDSIKLKGKAEGFEVLKLETLKV